MNSKLNPFGNADEPIPKYLLHGKPEWLRVLAWWGRNPLHNFSFYWIGVAGRVIGFKGEFLTEGWQFAYVRTKYLYLPLVSYKGKYLEGYGGWRKNGGFSPPYPRKSGAKKVKSHL